ncbi:putative phage abortive infection protein [Pectobacterium carotovorum]|uniref:putative phage abortive infection protein n=1 Tax=Pectobacterium carotovorum TaxID=554 RepID=UPI002B242DCE|nr:putative phage abortive infection protein [Pectobacterium carotovorum]
MKLRFFSISFLKNLINKKIHPFFFVNDFLKTSIGALIFTVIFIFIFIFIFIELNILTDLSAASSFVSAIATGIICFFTVKSVLEVINSNEENRSNNQKKDRKESFEKKFALLLQEHNSYLSKLINANNPLYQLDYILNCSGNESRSIIRGSAKTFFVNGSNFYYSDNLLLVELGFWISEDGAGIYFEPSLDVINNLKLRRDAKLPSIYASSDCAFFYLIKYDKIIETDRPSFISENNKLKDVINRKLSEVTDLVPGLISRSNDISKNILSPYMRIIYHILKVSKENTSGKEDMKRYTNILRSIIPYDVLMLIAINSMYFYKSHDEGLNETKRWGDLFNDSNCLFSPFFNDYHKYYKLLIECDFFEHLIMRFSNVMDKSENITLNADISKIEGMVCKSDKSTRYLLLYGDIESNLSVIYKEVNQATMKFDTDVLVLFFFNQDFRVERVKKNIIEDLISKSRNTKIEGRVKSDTNNSLLSRYSTIFKEDSVIFLSLDFYCLYTTGEFPQVFTTIR